MSSQRPARCPNLGPDRVICTFPEGHEGPCQGVETQYRWYTVGECPDCGNGLTEPDGGGVECHRCRYWFCY